MLCPFVKYACVPFLQEYRVCGRFYFLDLIRSGEAAFSGGDKPTEDIHQFVGYDVFDAAGVLFGDVLLRA